MGLSVLEIVIAVAILGVALGIGSLLVPRDGFALDQAAKGLLADVQLTRLEAVSGARYVRLAIEPAENRYRVVEVDWNGTAWTEVAQLKVVAMSDQRTERVTIAANAVNDLIYDPRGNPIGLGSQSVVFSSRSGRSVSVSISQQGLARL